MFGSRRFRRAVGAFLLPVGIQALLFQALFISGAFDPVAAGTYIPPESTLLGPVYYDYGIFGPMFWAKISAMGLLFKAALLGVVAVVALETCRWVRQRKVSEVTA